MTDREKQQWEKVRAKGFVPYLVRRGFLLYGLVFGVLMTLENVFISHEAFTPVRDTLIRFVHYVLEFGAFMGVFTWWLNQYDYRKPTEEE